MQEFATVEFDIKSVHKMVNKQQALGNDVRWDGWDVVFFRPVEHAVYSKNGVFRNGTWGFDNRIQVNSEGKWRLEARNIINPRRSGPRP